MMTTQRLEQTAVGGRRMVGGWIIGFALVALLAAGWMIAPAPAQQAAAAAQPIVGRAITITGLVFDDTRYVNMPIAVGATIEQPVVGRAITVMGLVFDGTRYVNMPIAVGAMRTGQGYAVTALVFDGKTYRNAPVQVGGH